MKKIVCLFLAVLFVVAFSVNTNAQKKEKAFKGVITYDVTVNSDEDIDPAIKNMMPKESEMKVSGNKSKTKMVMGGMMEISTVANGENKTVIMLFDMMGQKFYHKFTEEDIKKQQEKDYAAKPEVKLIDETKVIAGYTCKKAEITTTDKENKKTILTIYYSEELGGKEVNFGDDALSEINGVALENEIDLNGIMLKMVAREVKKGGVSETDFLIPTDYQEMTEDQFKNMFGGE